MTKFIQFTVLVLSLCVSHFTVAAPRATRAQFKSCRAMMVSAPQLARDINSLYARIVALQGERIMAYTSMVVVNVPALSRGGQNTLVLQRRSEGGDGWRVTFSGPNQRPNPQIQSRYDALSNLDDRVNRLVRELRELVEDWIDATTTVLIAPLASEYISTGTINHDSMEAIRAGVILGDMLPYQLEQAVMAQRGTARRSDKLSRLAVQLRDHSRVVLEQAFAAIPDGMVYTARITEYASTAKVGMGTFRMPLNTTNSVDQEAKYLTGSADAIGTFSPGYSLQALAGRLASGAVAFEGVFHRDAFDLASVPPAVLMIAHFDDIFLNPMQ